jgi:hypothetical protein
MNGVEHWNLVFEKFATARGRHACDYICAVLHAGFCVKAACLAGDALNEEPGIRANEN